MDVTTDPVDVFLVEPATRGDPQRLRDFDLCRKYRPEWRALTQNVVRRMGSVPIGAATH